MHRLTIFCVTLACCGPIAGDETGDDPETGAGASSGHIDPGTSGTDDAPTTSDGPAETSGSSGEAGSGGSEATPCARLIESRLVVAKDLGHVQVDASGCLGGELSLDFIGGGPGKVIMTTIPLGEVAGCKVYGGAAGLAPLFGGDVVDLPSSIASEFYTIVLRLDGEQQDILRVPKAVVPAVPLAPHAALRLTDNSDWREVSRILLEDCDPMQI